MKRLILITSMMALGLMSVGCSKARSNSNGNVNTAGIGGENPVLIDPNATNGVPSFSTGFTADLNTTYQAMLQYTSIPGNFSGLNNPQNIKINLNFAHVADGRYGGTVTISYYDNGILRTGTFDAGTGRNPTYSGMHDNNKLQAEYNFWFNFENKTVFTGFFEDSFGAITISLEPEVVSGGGNDAEPLNVKYKGSVHFKNFAPTNMHQKSAYRSCWHTYAGPFDCRSNIIQTKCGLAPGVEAGYTLLGTFTNVDVKKAFNIN